ncbi:hypothetical protein PVAP13_5NG234981 [Panicum virgatum]|uniref:Uncharacterized protein n=1 Tax=Panicum virgatum TaxID=38727 RepID=A0A8T0RW49_PANVG|nr:hypothetical protein PVAP13_5NG234981 [Panicum virgatum]
MLHECFSSSSICIHDLFPRSPYGHCACLTKDESRFFLNRVSWQVSYSLLARVISCDPFGYQLSQTCGGHRVICSLLQNSTFTLP